MITKLRTQREIKDLLDWKIFAVWVNSMKRFNQGTLLSLQDPGFEGEKL